MKVKTPKRRYSDGAFKQEELPTYLKHDEKEVIKQFKNELVDSESRQIVLVKDHFGNHGS